MIFKWGLTMLNHANKRMRCIASLSHKRSRSITDQCTQINCSMHMARQTGATWVKRPNCMDWFIPLRHIIRPLPTKTNSSVNASSSNPAAIDIFATQLLSRMFFFIWCQGCQVSTNFFTIGFWLIPWPEVSYISKALALLLIDNPIRRTWCCMESK